MRRAKRALCHASGKITHRKPESFPPFRPSMTSFYCFRHFFVSQDFFLHFRWQRVPLTPHFHFLHMFNIEMTDPLSLDIFTALKVCWITALAAVIVSIKPQDIVSFAAYSLCILKPARSLESSVQPANRGLAISLRIFSLSSLRTILMLTRSCMFFIVFPNTELFMSL